MTAAASGSRRRPCCAASCSSRSVVADPVVALHHPVKGHRRRGRRAVAERFGHRVATARRRPAALLASLPGHRAVVAEPRGRGQELPLHRAGAVGPDPERHPGSGLRRLVDDGDGPLAPPEVGRDAIQGRGTGRPGRRRRRVDHRRRPGVGGRTGPVPADARAGRTRQATSHRRRRIIATSCWCPSTSSGRVSALVRPVPSAVVIVELLAVEVLALTASTFGSSHHVVG